ncbi:acyl carrier protein [Streptomyces sp. NPDC053755]|uniref:acyl carrier protein n=1 Tax=unclassified Streptomyces TaxID=2593676 RepID=UPI00343CC228
MAEITYDQAYKKVHDILSGQYSSQPIHPGTSLDELGVDELALTEVAGKLGEAFGVDIEVSPESIRTVEDLARAVANAPANA